VALIGEKAVVSVGKWASFLRGWGRRGLELPGTAWNLRAFSGWYLLEMLVRLMELAGMFVLYDTLMEWVKWNSRALNAEEMVLARRAFGDSIRLDLVRVDAMAFSTRITRERFAYVGFQTVNFWKEVNTSELVHELVHVWHYEQMGAAYTVRALRAQRSKEGYNYGGVGILRERLAAGQAFLDFNLEQQAEIVMDCFRLQMGWKPAWGDAKKEDLDVYCQILRPFFPIAQRADR
jgi:hypothetical protein